MNIAVSDYWYPVAMCSPLEFERQTMLLGEKIEVGQHASKIWVKDSSNKDLPYIIKYGHIWASSGCPGGDLFKIPEVEEEGRRLVDCGSIKVKCSPLRAVENFLDIAHFPFVHTDILGSEPHTEVHRYEVKIDQKENEVWAKKIKFFQPKAAQSAETGITIEYMYRVVTPTSAILYKTCPAKPWAWDIITLFVQPLTETTCEVWAWMAIYDDATNYADLVNFQQMIFMQDRSILENQTPIKLPLDPGKEIPTQADLTSVAYRRWLKKLNYTFGAEVVAV